MVLSYGCCRVALFVTALAKRGSYLTICCYAANCLLSLVT